MPTGHRWFAGCAIALSLLGACKNPTALESTAANVAKAQGVDESAVMSALRRFAATEDEQLRLAQSWEANLPTPQIPNLTATASRFDSVIDNARQVLRNAGCQAVFDILNTGQIPNAAAFVESYLTDVALGYVPHSDLLEIGESFEDLYQDAVAGTLDYLDVRLTLMEFQYCN